MPEKFRFNVIASVAPAQQNGGSAGLGGGKQSKVRDCFVAIAPRNDGEYKWKN